MKNQLTVLFAIIFLVNLSCSKEFYDKFPDNKNQWLTYEKSNAKINVSNGLFINQISSEVNAYITKDFGKIVKEILEVECSINKFEGATGVGLIWNFADEQTHNRFIITTRDQQFFIQYRVNGERENIKEWTTNTAIAKSDGTNVFKLKQNGSSLEFYLNEALVHTQENSNLSLNQIGVMLGSTPDSRCKINYFKVKKK